MIIVYRLRVSPFIAVLMVTKYTYIQTAVFFYNLIIHPIVHEFRVTATH